MKINKFETIQSSIKNNPKLRIPQKEAYEVVESHFADESNGREVSIVLPVGCGKSGLLAIIPFALKPKRVLVIAPGLKIKKQLFEDLSPTNRKMFYLKCEVLDGQDFPEPAIIEGNKTNRGDLESADIVVANIQQIQGQENKWLGMLPNDFFDLILIDEAHHNVADSWAQVRNQFKAAKIVNFSATPMRSDGQMMSGSIIYSFPIFRAIEKGYIKRLTAKVLNPATLKYVRNDDGNEIEVSLDEIRQLGETDAAFRKSIVSSKETLDTIVNCSINELLDLRDRTKDDRHKIIASALNYSHCIQITEAFRARNLRADYIHSQEEGAVNQKILEKLERHELDVIVQVRMLGEGFDHPYLSVAAVCSVFSNLAPFVQFVGRIMRVVDQDNPSSPNNKGVVIYHAGSNVAKRWSDFQKFSEADQEFYDQLLPVEDISFEDISEVEIKPRSGKSSIHLEIKNQEAVAIEEVPLLQNDIDAQNAIRLLREKGFEVLLKPIYVTQQKGRLASRSALDSLIKTKASQLLAEASLNPVGRDLDRNVSGKSNFVVIKSAIDRKVNELLGIKSGKRNDPSQADLDKAKNNLENISKEVKSELLNGKA